MKLALFLTALALALPLRANEASAFSAFADPELATLIDRALVNNQDLAAAAARVNQARALAGAARADFFPQVAVDASAARQRNLDNNYRASDYARLPGVATWELDLWGRIRKSTKAARAEAGAAQATFEAARVSLSAEVAQTHYTLRATELERTTVERSVVTRRDARRIIADRAEIGTSSPLDLARADTELATAEAELAAVSQRVATLRHGLAVLIGSESPIDFAQLPALPAPPSIPADLPADLLQRRPDIFAAQLTLDAASARIGVARAAFFPTIALTGSAGWESSDFSDLLSGDTRVWSFGPKLYLPLFQGGRNRANLTRAEAAFAEQSARYRQSVLVAFRDVRDALAATRFLAEQTSATERAATAARRASDLSRIRYDAGAVSYLEVVESERSALDAERSLARLRGQRLVAAASLIRALGGGWENASATTAPLLARN
jgi:multidrug efflux system outer membrane protein